MDYQEVGVKVAVPAKGRQEHDAVEEAGADDGALLKVLEGQELDGGKLGLPEVKGREEEDAQNLHGDDVGSGPVVWGVGRQTVGQQQEGEGSDEQQDAEEVKLNKVKLDRGKDGAALDGALRADDALPLGHAEHVGHEAHGGQTAGDEDDGKGAKGPAEVDLVVEELSNGRTSKGTGNARRADHADGDHAVAQRRHICHHDINNVHEADVTRPVEDVGGNVGLDVFASRLHDHADDADNQHDEEALDTAPKVNDLGEREGRARSNDAGENAADVEETVGAERRGDVRVKSGVDGVLENVHKRNEIQAVQRGIGLAS